MNRIEKHILALFALAFSLGTQAQIPLTLDTVLLRDTEVRRISTIKNHAWAIVGKSWDKVYSIGNQDALQEHPLDSFSPSFTDLAALDSNEVFIGTPDNYLIAYKDGQGKILGKANGITCSKVTSVITSYNPVVIGTDSGCFTSYNKSSFDRSGNADPYIIQYANAKEYGALYYKTTGTNNPRWKPYSLLSIAANGIVDYRFSSTLVKDSIRTAYIVADNYYSKQFFGTKSGLKLKPSAQTDSIKDLLPGITVNKLVPLGYFSTCDYLLIGTDNGLYYVNIYTLDKPPFFVKQTEGYSIYDMEADASSSKIWLATNKGLMRLSIRDSLGTQLNIFPFGQQKMIQACKNGLVEIKAYDWGGNYQWLKEGKPIAGANQATLTTLESGKFQAVLALPSLGKVFLDTSDVITITRDTTVCNFNPLPDTIVVCHDTLLTLSVKCPLYDPVNVRWYFKGQQTSWGNQSLLTSTGMLSVQSDMCGATYMDSVYIKRKEGALNGPTAFCEGEKVKLVLSGVSPSSIHWYRDGVEDPSLKDTVVYLNKGGEYKVQWTENGCFRERDTYIWKLDPSSMPTLPKDTFICGQQQIFLNLSMNGVASYVWQDGSYFPFYIVQKPGTYWVKVSWGTNCVISDTVAVRNGPASIQLPNDMSFCKDTSFILNLANDVNAQYTWQDGSTGPDHLIAESGLYWVKADYGNNCIASDTMRVDYYHPPSSYLASNSTYCNTDLPIGLSAYSYGSNYKWQDGSTEALFLVYEPGTYSVDVSNACGTQHLETKVSVKECIPFKIADYIMPAGDPWEQYFWIQGLRSTCQLEMYNELGVLVFASNDYHNEWDGGNCPGGLYFYRVHSVEDNQDFKGNVVLIK